MFKIEITSLQEFITFIAIIRGDELNIDKIKKLTEELNMNADKLVDAEKKGA